MRNFLSDAKCLHPIDDPIFISSSEATFLLYLISDARIFKLMWKLCIKWLENFASINAKKTKMQTQKSTFSPKLNVAHLWLEYLSKFRKISANLNIDEINNTIATKTKFNLSTYLSLWEIHLQFFSYLLSRFV